MITAQSVILEAQTILQDLTGVRWPASELVRYLNDVQRDIAVKRPDAVSAHVSFSCVAGAKQTLPSTAMLLLDVIANASNVAVTKVDRTLLEATKPDWQTTTQAAPVHFMQDTTDFKTFWVYPPAPASHALTVRVAEYPAEISAPSAPGKLASTVSGNVDLPDELETACIYGTVYWAYMRDSEFNPNLAAQYLGLFKAELGEQSASAVAVAPKE